MASKIEWDKIAQDIEKAFGGKDNITKFFHCATRLRVEVKDDSKVNREKLNKINLVKGTNKEGAQWQVILGAGTVNKVFDKFAPLISVSKTNTETTKKPPLWNNSLKWHTNLLFIFRKLIRDFADIFIPLIPVFIAGGLALAFNSLVGTIAQSYGTQNSAGVKSAQTFLELIGGGILGSLPVFVGYTAMKKFGGTPMLGVAIGIILVAPSLVNGWSSGDAVNWTNIPVNQEPLEGQVKALFPSLPTLFSFQLIGYQAQVFPVLMVIGVAFGIEKLMKKITPEFLAILVIPIVTVFLSVFLGFFIIGPIGRYIGYGIAKGMQGLFVYTNFPGFGLGGAILGFVYPFMVLTGLHQGLLPIEAQLIAETTKEYSHAFTWITPIATVSNISQGVVGLTMIFFFVKKAPKLVSSAASGGLSANLGITEPIVFGINLPVRFGMLAVAISSALGGYWVGATHTVANSLGSASWLGIAVQFDYVVNENYAKYLVDNNVKAMLTNLPPIANIAIAATISTASSVGLTLLFGKTFGKKSLEEFIQKHA